MIHHDLSQFSQHVMSAVEKLGDKALRVNLLKELSLSPLSYGEYSKLYEELDRLVEHGHLNCEMIDHLGRQRQRYSVSPESQR